MTDENQNVVWQADHKPFGESTITVATIENNLRFPGQYFDAESGLHYNYFRYYDPETGRYITSDPIGLNGGVNTYAYVGGNPLSRIDPYGLRCVQGVGCYTTPEESSAADSGNYNKYYQLACAGGDAYACFAQHVAANDNLDGHLATWWLNRALDEHAEESKQCIDKEGVMEQIRKDLANAYADYLAQSQDKASWPTVNGVTQFHWNEFAKYGLPPSTFGGTPGGSTPVWSGHWCPNCR